MTPNDLNDPRFTAYALGEVEPAEAAIIEAQLARDPKLQEYVEELRATARFVTAELAAEPVLTLTDSQRAVIEAPPPLRPRFAFNARSFWLGAGAAAAASLMISAVVVNSISTDRSEKVATQVPRSFEQDQREMMVIAPSSEDHLVERPVGFDRASAPHYRPRLDEPTQSEHIAEESPARGSVGGARARAERQSPPGGSIRDRQAASAPATVEVATSSSPGASVRQHVPSPVDVGLRDEMLLARDGAARRPQTRQGQAIAIRAAGEGQDFISPLAQPVAPIPVVASADSYENVRRHVSKGQLPPPEEVRIEELLNNFSYDFSRSPADGPVQAHVEVNAAPWNPRNRLVQIGVVANDARAMRGAESAEEIAVEVEFNPSQVLGYRMLATEPVDVDPALPDATPARADARQSAQMVTALYEIVPNEAPAPAEVTANALRYQQQMILPSPELLTVKVRYRQGDDRGDQELEIPLVDAGAQLDEASPEFRFASAVAAFGMVLRDWPHRGNADFERVRQWAMSSLTGRDPQERHEFIRLVEEAERIAKSQRR